MARPQHAAPPPPSQDQKASPDKIEHLYRQELDLFCQWMVHWVAFGDEVKRLEARGDITAAQAVDLHKTHDRELREMVRDTSPEVLRRIVAVSTFARLATEGHKDMADAAAALGYPRFLALLPALRKFVRDKLTDRKNSGPRSYEDYRASGYRDALDAFLTYRQFGDLGVFEWAGSNHTPPPCAKHIHHDELRRKRGGVDGWRAPEVIYRQVEEFIAAAVAVKLEGSERWRDEWPTRFKNQTDARKRLEKKIRERQKKN